MSRARRRRALSVAALGALLAVVAWLSCGDHRDAMDGAASQPTTAASRDAAPPRERVPGPGATDAAAASSRSPRRRTSELSVATDAPVAAAEPIAPAGPPALPDKPSVPVRVTVLHPDGSPASGATVVLLDSDWCPPPEQLATAPRATTDADGKATLPCTFESGRTYAWLGDEAGVSSMSRTANARGGKAVDDTIPMARAAVVRGRTVDTTGRALPGALVRASLGVGGYGGWLVFAASTDESGAFEFPPMPVERPGRSATVELLASAEGFHPRKIRFASGRPPADVVTLALFRGGVLSGRLLFPDRRPAAGRTVVLDELVHASATSGADGRFELPLAPQDRDVVVLPAGYYHLGSTPTPDRRPEIGGWSGSKLLGRFRGDAGDRDLGDVVLDAVPGPKVVVVDADGTALDRAEVRVELAGHQVDYESTDASGRLELPPLGAEEHVVTAEEAWTDNGWQRRTGRATVHGGDAEVRVVVAGRSGIVVRVVDEADRAPVKARLEKVFFVNRATHVVARGFLGGGWGYRPVARAELAADTYDVEAKAEGYEPARIEGVVVTGDRDTEIEIALRTKPR